MAPQLRTSLGRFSVVAIVLIVLTAVLSGLTEWNKHHDLTLTGIAVITELIGTLSGGAVIGAGDASRASRVEAGDLTAVKESDVGATMLKQP